jgi:hypothetical protein
MKNFRLITVCIALGFLFLGCSKTEGVGGKAKIQGVFMANYYSDAMLTQFTGKGPVSNDNVFIVYGTEDSFYDDNVKTSFDGSFVFSYLKPGKYTLFTYENCYPCASLTKEKLIEVEITKKDEVIDIGEVLLKKQQ